MSECESVGIVTLITWLVISVAVMVLALDIAWIRGRQIVRRVKRWWSLR